MDLHPFDETGVERDAAGVKRMISIRGDNRALRPEDNELRRYTDREATYFGNSFNGSASTRCSSGAFGQWAANI